MKPLGWLAAAGVCASAVFDIGGAILLRRWTTSRTVKPLPATTPITILRPIKSGVREWRALVRDTLAVMGEHDQLVLGVSERLQEATEEEKARDTRLEVVVCPETRAGNPKIEKLLRMAPVARNPIWCLLDAEACISRELLEVCRAECDERTLVTASYYFGGKATSWDRLDQTGFYGFFWPGVAWARCGGEPGFAFGACMALRREFLEQMGGLANFADRLAEDYWLGRETVLQGGRVLQVPIPVELQADRTDCRSLWKTICRRMVTYRTCRPESFGGTIATQGPMWATLLLALKPGKPWRWLVFLASLAVRSGAIAANRKSVSGDRCVIRPAETPIFALAASLLETMAWALAWIVPSVEWSGRKLRIGGDGRIR